MPKLRDIREKALLNLFAYATQKEAEVNDSTWDLTLEPEQGKIDKLSVKAIKHLLSGLPKQEAELSQLAPVIAPMMKTYELKKEARTLLSIAKGTTSLSSLFSQLDSQGDNLSAFIYQAKALNASLQEFRTALTPDSFSSPELPKLLKTTKALSDLLQRVDFIASPTEYSDQKAIHALQKAVEEKNDLLASAEKYTSGIIENLESIDEAIKNHLANFSTNQIGRVELSLLRLGAYEIMILGEPKSHVINDALEIARKYTTEDAVPLINGVLDKIS